jgi:hypothetical protein
LQRLVESQREAAAVTKEERAVEAIGLGWSSIPAADHAITNDAEKPKPVPEPPSKLEEQARRYLEQAGNEKATADELRAVLRSIDRIMLDVRTYPMDHGMRVGMNEIELLLAKSRSKFQIQ